MEYYEVTYQCVVSECVRTLHVEANDIGDAEIRFFLIFKEKDYDILDIKVDHEFLNDISS